MSTVVASAASVESEFQSLTVRGKKEPSVLRSGGDEAKLESNYTAHSSDQNSFSTGPESHTALTTLYAMLSLSTDVVLAKWSVIIFAS